MNIGSIILLAVYAVVTLYVWMGWFRLWKSVDTQFSDWMLWFVRSLVLKIICLVGIVMAETYL